jgi:predicted RNA polymerase sigma factor
VVEGDALRTALARLTPQDAACLLLRVVQGFSASEVGAIVGASAETVTKRLSRARQRLRGAYLAVNDPGGDPHASAHENAHVNAHEANHGAYDLRPDAAPKEQARS